jgi:integrase/recombinase XerD
MLAGIGWFCTHLFRAGMRREYIKELRGDSRKEAFDLYNHIDLEELKRLIWRLFHS